MPDGFNASENVSTLPGRRPTSIDRRLKDLSSLALFLGELVSNPRSIGAPVPSSRFLARDMAAFVPSDPEGYVVELGPGTGVITTALLERGVPPEKLLLVERSYEMAKLLRKQFPGVKVLFGDATHLSRLLSKCIDLDQERVSHIVSSLPLRSLPKQVVDGITSEVQAVLGKHGRFIQYTYALRHGCNGALRKFRKASSKVVWLNLPPARVELFHTLES